MFGLFGGKKKEDPARQEALNSVKALFEGKVVIEGEKGDTDSWIFHKIAGIRLDDAEPLVLVDIVHDCDAAALKSADHGGKKIYSYSYHTVVERMESGEWIKGALPVEQVISALEKQER
jgi:hypothetical protein